MFTLKETLEWYRTHRTTRELGYNPDGMCQKICRKSSDLPARYGSAKISQDATPKEYRIKKVRDLRAGMKLYFDDPKDSNKFGHVVTMIGRVKGGDWDSLDDVLVETNSVQSGKLTVVRASYFKKHWGDDFQFGTIWFNGFVLELETKLSRAERFRKSYPNYNVKLLDAASSLEGRRDLGDKRDRIDELVKRLKAPEGSRIAKVKAYYLANRILRLDQLNLAVSENPKALATTDVRNKLRTVIKSIPRD